MGEGEMSGPRIPATRRRWLRISLRGLLVLVLIVGGWLGWAVRSARTQREAVAAIRRAGGGITYRSQYLGGNVYGHLYDHGAKPW
jgi:hypothetical protein